MIRAFLVIVLAALFSSCQTPLPEINYRGALSDSVNDVIAAGDRFVSVFSQESGFKVDRRMAIGEAAKDTARLDFHLRTDATKRVWIYVTADTKERAIFVTIGGDFTSPTAVEAARRSEKVFAQLFPGSTYSPFPRYQSFLGP